MSADALITRDGPVAVPMDYKVPASGEIIPLSVAALFDGTSAGGSFEPTLELISPDGRVIVECPLNLSIAAGASAFVSWFPGLAAASAGISQTFIGATIRAGILGTMIPNDAATDLTYGGVEIDTNGMANLGADARILTVNTAGYYLVSCGTLWSYNNKGRRINLIFHNGYAHDLTAQSVVADSRMQPWDPFPGDGIGGNNDNLSARVIQAAAGDFFSSGAYQNSGATIQANPNGPASAFLTAVLIGV